MAGWRAYQPHSEIREFTCARCRFSGRARASVVGVGRATLLFDSPDKAVQRARQDAVERAARAVRVALCKRCGERNPGQVMSFWWPYALATGVALGGGYYYLPMMLYPLMVVGIPLLGWRQLRRIDRCIEWLG